jgi:hypothetical protein
MPAAQPQARCELRYKLFDVSALLQPDEQLVLGERIARLQDSQKGLGQVFLKSTVPDGGEISPN